MRSLNIDFYNRSQKGNRAYQPPPRHADEHRNSKRMNNSNPTTSSYPQYNGGSNVQQNKPPRFQRNQESQHQYQHDAGREAHQRSQPNDYRNPFAQSRISSVSANDDGNENYNKSQADPQGKNHLGSNRNYNHVEPDARNRHPYDASYGKHNRVQHEGASKVYSSNTTERNFKNQPKYQTNYNAESRIPMNPNTQKSENNYSNQNANISANNTWVWHVGDKCMAKYWEDNRVHIIFLMQHTYYRFLLL